MSCLQRWGGWLLGRTDLCVQKLLGWGIGFKLCLTGGDSFKARTGPPVSV